MRQSRPLIGRATQLGVIDAHLRDLDRGLGALLLLVGEPGIGKTRLAEELVTAAQTRGVRTVWSTAWTAADGAPPLWPWSQILTALSGSADALHQRGPDSPVESSAARFAQLEAVAGLLRAAATETPLVVVIDDLHAADAGSVRMLTFVAASLRDAPCLLVTTYRRDELPRDHAADLVRVGQSLAVPPLSDGEAGELLTTAVGIDVAPAALAAVVDRSHGNPLFVWEFGQLMAHGGRLDVAPAAIPEAVAAVIERRLARLTEGDVAVLRVAAIAGDPCPAALAAQIGDVRLDDAVAALATAAAAGLVIEIEPPGHYRFSHDLVRDVVLDGIEPRRRADLHRRAADALEERARVDPSLHRSVAHHLAGAGPAHAREASRHWEQAGRRAVQLLTYEDAVTCFAQAAHSSDDPSRRARLHAAEADAALLAGDLVHARAQFGAAADLARDAGDAELFATTVLGMGMGPVAWEVPLASGEHAAMVAEAIARLPDDATRLRSMLLARLSVTAATPDTTHIARARAEEALDLARGIGEPGLIGQALAALNDAIAGPSHTTPRRENADVIVELAREAGDRALELLGLRFRLVADLETGDLRAVDHDIAAFTRLAEELRQPLVSWYVPLWRGMRAQLAGDVDAADRFQTEVETAADATGSHNASMLSATLRLGLDLTTGRPVAADALDSMISADPAAWATLAAGLAMTKWRAGEPEEARRMLQLHSRNDFSRVGEDSELLTTLIWFGQVAMGLGEDAAVARVYDLLLPHTGLWAVDGIGAFCWGPTDMELSRLAMALGRVEDARAHLARARESVDRAGAPLLAAAIEELERTVGDGPPSVAPVDSGGLPGTSVFHREGPFWTLTYRDRTVRVKDAKGLHDLARLLAEPGRELHVLDLGAPGAGADRQRAGEAGTAEGDLGVLLDARARADYRRRLAELDDALAEAEADADLARAEKARDERDFIAHELAAALGMGGRTRRVGDPAERARKAVTGRIRMAIARIDHEHPALGRHLANAVRTGTYCAYEPEVDTTWEL